MNDTIEIDMKGLNKFVASIKGPIPVIKIGILGDKNSRSQNGSNAEIGAKHEFGVGVPQRSFLRMPLNEKLADYLEESSAFDNDTLNLVVKSGTLKPWLQKIAITAEKVVADAFASGGFGQWRKWATGYSNNTGQILVDTQQLRNSITSEVK